MYCAPQPVNGWTPFISAQYREPFIRVIQSWSPTHYNVNVLWPCDTVHSGDSFLCTALLIYSISFFWCSSNIKQSTLVLKSIDIIQSLINSIKKNSHLPLFNAFIWKALGVFTSQSQMYLKCILLDDNTSWGSVQGLVEIDNFWHIAILSTSWTLNRSRDRSHYSAHFRRQHGPHCKAFCALRSFVHETFWSVKRRKSWQQKNEKKVFVFQKNYEKRTFAQVKWEQNNQWMHKYETTLAMKFCQAKWVLQNFYIWPKCNFSFLFLPSDMTGTILAATTPLSIITSYLLANLSKWLS